MTDTAFYTISTSHLRDYCDPYNGCWRDLDTPLTLDDVTKYLTNGTAKLHPEYDSDLDVSVPLNDTAARQRHAEQVAWFVQHGFTQPLDLDVGVPELGCHVSWIVQDGNHRLAAAIYRLLITGEDLTLTLAIEGSLDYAHQLGFKKAPLPNENEDIGFN